MRLGYRKHVPVSLKEQMVVMPHQAHRLSERKVAKLMGVHRFHRLSVRRTLKLSTEFRPRTKKSQHVFPKTSYRHANGCMALVLASTQNWVPELGFHTQDSHRTRVRNHKYLVLAECQLTFVGG